METLKILIELWPIIFPIILSIVWMIRLEGKTNYNLKLTEQNERSLDELRIKHENLDSKVVEKLSGIEKSLARVEGFLSRSKDN
jgi:hypothetical protein